MMPLLGQAFPGMEWIPVMLFATAAGGLAGILSITLRPFHRLHVAGRRLAISSLVIGVASPLFFLVVVGSEVFAYVYLILAAPAALGGLALLVYPRAISEARGFPVVPSDRRDSEAG
jgi:hypothetical protein